MPDTVLSAGADRRLGRQSRDPADCLSAYLTGLEVTLVPTPRALRTGVLTFGTPRSNQPLCIAAAVYQPTGDAALSEAVRSSGQPRAHSGLWI